MTFLPACAQLGIPTANTFNQRLAIGYTTVSTVRDTATVLLNSKKISVKDAENVQEQANNARSGLDLARTMFRDGQATSAESKLTTINTALRALQTYLAGKQ
jgi:hypothetical protein